MKNVTIVIDDKHEYLSSTKTHRRKRKSDGSFDQVSPVKQRIIGQPASTPDGQPVTPDQSALRGMETLPIQIIESEGDERGVRIGVPFPNDLYKFIPQAEKDLLDSYSKKNHQASYTKYQTNRLTYRLIWTILYGININWILGYENKCRSL